MGLVEKKLEELDIKLLAPMPPVANYLGTKQVGNLLYVSGRKSELIGAVGEDVSLEQAKLAARDTVIILLAIVKNDILDLDKIKGVVKVQGFVRSAPGFDKQPFVIDGATELLIEIFGEDGKHARTATGVSDLPFGATIQLDMVFEMKS